MGRGKSNSICFPRKTQLSIKRGSVPESWKKLKDGSPLLSALGFSGRNGQWVGGEDCGVTSAQEPPQFFSSRCLVALPSLLESRGLQSTGSSAHPSPS